MNAVGLVSTTPPLLTSICTFASAVVMNNVAAGTSLYTPLANVIVVSPEPADPSSTVPVPPNTAISTSWLNVVIRLLLPSRASIRTANPTPAVWLPKGSFVNTKWSNIVLASTLNVLELFIL